MTKIAKAHIMKLGYAGWAEKPAMKKGETMVTADLIPHKLSKNYDPNKRIRLMYLPDDDGNVKLACANCFYILPVIYNYCPKCGVPLD